MKSFQKHPNFNTKSPRHKGMKVVHRSWFLCGFCVLLRPFLRSVFRLGVFVPCVLMIALSSSSQARESANHPPDRNPREQVVAEENELQDVRAKAEAGDMEEQAHLGKRLQDGNGVTKNFQEAVQWYSKAAEQGHAEAQFQLGRMYQEGQGTEKNLEEAAKWYLRAANQGSHRAQGAMGRMLMRGQGVPKDDVEAAKWFRISSKGDQGFGAYMDSKIISERLTPEQTAEARQRAAAFVPTKESPATSSPAPVAQPDETKTREEKPPQDGTTDTGTESPPP